MQDDVVGDLVDVELVARAVLHGAQDGRPERGVFYLGRPYTAPLNLDTASGHLRSYAEERRGAAQFRHLVVDLTLAPRAGEPIRHVTVSVTTSLADDSQTPVLFRAASPQRLARAITRGSRLAVKTQLGVANPEAERVFQYESEEPFLLARGVGTDTVQWEFRATPGQALDGSHELTATLEVPTGVSGSILLAAAVDIRKKRLGLIGYEARLPHDLNAVPFT